MRARLVCSGLVALLVVGCSSDGTTTTTLSAEGLPAMEVAADLIAAIQNGDFESAAALTVADQMSWVVMAEGATLGQAAGLDDEGSLMVAANYWRGFSESAQFPPWNGDGVEELTVGDMRFAVIAIDSRSRLVMRYSDGWQADVIASFAPALANRLLDAAQTVNANRGEDAEIMKAVIASQRPSIEVANGQPGLPENTQNDLDQLLDILAELANS